MSRSEGLVLLVVVTFLVNMVLFMVTQNFSTAIFFFQDRFLKIVASLFIKGEALFKIGRDFLF